MLSEQTEGLDIVELKITLILYSCAHLKLKTEICIMMALYKRLNIEHTIWPFTFKSIL